VGKAVLGAAVVGSALLIGCLVPRHLNTSKAALTPMERLKVLRRARVWMPTSVSAMNMREGPPEPRFGTGATIPCDFVDKKFGGHTPKFGCSANDEDVLKVRYGRDNGEVYAGVAATRLLWALGFGADAMYPVTIVCRGCPERLRREGTQTGDAITFDVAAIERKFPGEDIEKPGGAGWSWAEVDLLDEREGGAPPYQRDALKLLAVLLQHTDTKPDQQRLVCRSGGKSSEELAACRDPLMMIHDVGQTFGHANLFNRSAVGSVNLAEWSKARVWADPAGCVGNLERSETGTLGYPTISEAGRKFLGDLLSQLTDAQLRDMFAVARFDRKPHGGGPIDAWVAAFKAKRTEILSRTCPS
jgi:hypothetical protein